MSKVVLSRLARDKLKRYKSKYYTEDETREYLRKLSTELESLLLNPFLSQRYTEE